MLEIKRARSNPINIAIKVGNSLAGDLGAEAFIELELAYATRLLPRFSDDRIIRVNQNVLLYWHHGYYKSTILHVFRETMPDHLKVVDLTSMTREKIFGSIDEKKKHIVQPAFTNDVHFVVISELRSLLGSTSSMKEFVDIMNIVLEGEKVTRQMLKLGHGDISVEELTELETKGVSYDPSKGELSYIPNVCVLAATRPLTNRYFTYLSGSGHFGRYHVIQQHITDEEASKHLHKDYKLDQKALEELGYINQRLSKVRVRKMDRPSESLMKPIYDNIEDLVRDEIAGRKRKLADIITPRLKDNLIRELVAHAFLRNAYENNFTEIQELRYNKEDVIFVKNRLYYFINFTMNPIIAKSLTHVTQRKTKTDSSNEMILKYLSDKEWHTKEEIFSTVNKRFTSEQKTVSDATIYNALKELEKTGKIEHEYGKYMIACTKDSE